MTARARAPSTSCGRLASASNPKPDPDPYPYPYPYPYPNPHPHPHLILTLPQPGEPRCLPQECQRARQVRLTGGVAAMLPTTSRSHPSWLWLDRGTNTLLRYEHIRHRYSRASLLYSHGISVKHKAVLHCFSMLHCFSEFKSARIRRDVQRKGKHELTDSKPCVVCSRGGW